MKNLLYKEFVLAKHPTCFIFLAFGLMLLIPSYPYYVAFMYMCLAIFFVFLTGRENKDVLFTAMLPVRKRDTVKARCTMIAILELTQIIVSVPIAVLSTKINPNAVGNEAGIEANVAFYGLALVMFAVFNIIYIPNVYKDVTKPGKYFVIAFTAVMLYILAAEVAVAAVPYLKATLDTSAAAMQIKQLPVLGAGIIIYALTTVLAYKRGAANFEKVNL